MVEKTDFAPVSLTRSRDAGASRTGSIVVTNGMDSFYESRTALQSLYDFGGFAKIVASTSSVEADKKVLISRNARYSGLLDALEFHDESSSAAGGFDGAGVWLALHADESQLEAQIDAAAAAGVKRAFILFSADGPTGCPADGAALEAKLASSGLEYTVMRTGSLSASAGGSGLRLGEVDTPLCDDVPTEDVYRFLSEALTLPEASNRAFSLCPSDATLPQLKEMRLCGYERRDEVRFVLTGAKGEPMTRVLETSAPAADAADASGATVEDGMDDVAVPDAETVAAREEELKALLQKARERGEATQARLKYEAEEAAKERKEWAARAKLGNTRPGETEEAAKLEAMLAKEDAKKADDKKPGDGEKPDEKKE